MMCTFEEKWDDHCLQWTVAAKLKVLADMTLELKELRLPEKKLFFRKKAKTVAECVFNLLK